MIVFILNEEWDYTEVNSAREISAEDFKPFKDRLDVLDENRKRIFNLPILERDFSSDSVAMRKLHREIFQAATEIEHMELSL